MVAGERESSSTIFIDDVASSMARGRPGDEINTAAVDVIPIVEPDVGRPEGYVALERFQRKVGDRLRELGRPGLEEQLACTG